MKPIAVAVSQTMAASPNVTMMWLVEVKLPGIMPEHVHCQDETKSVNTQGKYFMPSSPITSRTILAMYS